jgi:hypothetical protein
VHSTLIGPSGESWFDLTHRDRNPKTSDFLNLRALDQHCLHLFVREQDSLIVARTVQDVKNLDQISGNAVEDEVAAMGYPPVSSLGR